MTRTPGPARSLVVAPNWVGDTVMALPVMEALAASGRRVSVLAPPHLHSLLELSPSIEQTIIRHRSMSDTLATLRRQSFDEAILLPNSFRAAWVVYRAGIPRRLGYRGDGRSLLLRPAVHRPDKKIHQERDYDRLLRRMGVAPVMSPPCVEVPPALDRQAVEALRRAGIEPSDDRSPLVGIFAGAEFGASKRWPLERFASVTRRLEQLPSGARPLLLAGPAERPLVERLRQASGNRYPIVGSDLDLAGLAGILRRFAILITNDSGPMHLAAAVGTPCVAVFGPTDPRRTSPCGDGHHVLYSGRWCSPCFRRRCPLIHQRCMTQIGVDDVVAAAAKVLRSATSHQPSS